MYLKEIYIFVYFKNKVNLFSISLALRFFYNGKNAILIDMHP